MVELQEIKEMLNIDFDDKDFILGDLINDSVIIIEASTGANLEIIKEIDRIFDLVKPESKKDMGKIMKEANVSLKGKADFKLVSEIVNSKLGA